MKKMIIDPRDLRDKGEFDGRASRPVPNSEVIQAVNGAVCSENLYNVKLLDKFLETYFAWIQSSEINKLHGLEKFDKLSYTHGTSQAFDFFFMAHKSRRFRCFRGDFVYHKVSWNSYFEDWKYIEDEPLVEGDAIIISLPFSDSGNIHPELEKTLDQCDKLNIPVLLDCAYYHISGGIEFDLNRPCIDTVTFSLSKPFYGAERLRIGMRCKKTYDDDAVDLFNQFNMLSRIALGVGIRLCESFHPDYNYNKFREKQLILCKELEIEPSDSVIFGLASKDHPKFKGYDRGSDYRRVCISKLLGDCNE